MIDSTRTNYFTATEIARRQRLFNAQVVAGFRLLTDHIVEPLRARAMLELSIIRDRDCGDENDRRPQ